MGYRLLAGYQLFVHTACDLKQFLHRWQLGEYFWRQGEIQHHAVGQRIAADANAVADITVYIQRLQQAQDVNQLVITQVIGIGYIHRRHYVARHHRREFQIADKKRDGLARAIVKFAIGVGETLLACSAIANIHDCRIEKHPGQQGRRAAGRLTGGSWAGRRKA